MTIPDTENLFTTETAGLPQVSGPHVARLHDGDTFDLHIGAARKSLDGADLRMLAYNGSVPGPGLHVDQGSQITVQVTNDGDVEATVHWHGLRLDNRYDGVPHETQQPIPIGGTFTYKLSSPMPGSTGITRTSAKISGWRWGCTARSWSSPPTRPTGLPRTGS
jgi:FtsP/CotA-like multicopper oxidase with cupredoxin domain